MVETKGWVENKKDKEHFGVHYVSKNIKNLNTDQLSLTNTGWQKKMRRREKWILKEYLDKSKGKNSNSKTKIWRGRTPKS